MSNIVSMKFKNQVHRKNSKSNGEKRTLFLALSKNASLLLIAIMFVAGSTIAVATKVPVKQVMSSYSYDVLVILVIMELFTNLIAETGIMQLLAIKIADISNGKKRLCLMMFGGMMFLISSCLNNITAVMMILPIVFVLLKTLEVDRKYVSVFFAVILALSNTGGAASPVGDFPAIVIMTSGITSFLSYLTHAFPLFAVTSTVLVVVWGLQVKNDVDDGAVRKLAISNLKSQYKNINIRFDVLKLLAVVFVGMFLAWSFVPQNILPPEVIAVLGYVVAMVICSTKGVKVGQTTDLKSVLTIASFLFFAQVISQTGVLNLIAAYLQSNIHNPKLLVMAIMVITSVVAGVFSAGPAAAAMMPIIIQVCNGPLNAYSDWIAVAYAAAICAGSSLFMWSATAGFILSGKVNDASIQEESGKSISWGVGQYMKFGFVNYVIQISIALIAMTIIL
ncbi:SLC13 family permease [Dorea longicatena]|uniref:SLC13 family permease n=1 Tax=Dorea longicatena TaxID=88431 RepID=UPI0032C087D8